MCLGEARICDVALENARPEGHTERAEWVLPAKWRVSAFARSLDDSPTPITKAISLDRSRRDHILFINALIISPYYSSDYASDSGSSTDDSETPSLHLQGFPPLVDALLNHQSKSPPEYAPDPRAAKRRRSRFTGKCDACGRRGHKATSCEFLAMYLWCQKYMSGCTEKEVKSAMDHWTEKNKE